jgi:putative hydrolase of the HAD superfamily
MKLLIWDFDGTLAYREGQWSGALLDVLNQHIPGHTITREQMRPHLRHGFPWHTPDQSHAHLTSADAWWAHLMPVFHAAFTANGFTPEQATLLAPYVRAAYCHPNAWFTYPETIATLAALAHAGWIHVILSNHVPELPDLVHQLGLDAFVTAIFTSAVIGYEKPHPAAFHHILSRMPRLDEVWMVGDNPSADIAGAAAVGVPGILVRTFDPAVAHCYDDLTQISACLSQSGV